jgi:hypothetical protein
VSDLYSLIRRSIIDRGLTSAAVREDVYRQARTAVIRELWSYEPSLTEDEIEARMAQFDRAIDQLEGDLTETFAEPQRALPSPPQQAAKGAVSVFEGYDRDTDYVPGYVAQRPRQAEPARPRGSRSAFPTSPGEAGGLDPLALRSAAIEAALRSGGDDLVYEPDPPEEAAIEADDDRDATFQRGHWSGEAAETVPDDDASEDRSWGAAGRANPRSDDAWDDGDHGLRAVRSTGDYDDRLPVYEDAEQPARTRAKRWRLALPAFLANLSEQNRVRVLIGAIAALSLALVVLAALMVWSLLGPSGGSTRTVVVGAEPPTSDGASASPGNVLQTFTVFDGGDPTVFESGAGNPVRFDKTAGFARISSSTADPGVRVMIGAGLAGRIAGRPVRVTLVARSSLDNGAAGLRFAYENGLAISHWQTAHLGGDFGSYDLLWRVPAMRADPGTDQLLIEPGIPGDGTAADIQLIRIEVLKAEP